MTDLAGWRTGMYSRFVCQQSQWISEFSSGPLNCYWIGIPNRTHHCCERSEKRQKTKGEDKTQQSKNCISNFHDPPSRRRHSCNESSTRLTAGNKATSQEESKINCLPARLCHPPSNPLTHPHGLCSYYINRRIPHPPAIWGKWARDNY